VVVISEEQTASQPSVLPVVRRALSQQQLLSRVQRHLEAGAAM
jgi:hypothetical protein